MTSMITNNAAMVALSTLRSINSSLDETNNRVSTGKKINSAADGAAYWSIATTLTSDNGALGAVKDAISLDKASVDTTTAGIKQITSALQTIKNALTSANSSTADRVSLQKDIASAITNINSAATSSVMNGANWLSVDSSATGYNSSKNLLSSFSRTAGAVTVGTTALDTGAFMVYNNAVAGSAGTSTGTSSTIDKAITLVAKTANTVAGATVVADTSAGELRGFMDTKYVIAGTAAGATANKTVTAAGGTSGTESISQFDISELTNTAADLAKIQAYSKIIDATMQGLQTGSTALGTTSTRLTSQQNFAQTLMDINTASVGALLDANMEEESTKLKALQTQQQLSVQSLSIANNSTSNVMTLFR